MADLPPVPAKPARPPRVQVEELPEVPPQDDASEDEVVTGSWDPEAEVRQDWFNKLGGQVKQWKQRFFVLQSGMFTYYKAPSGRLLGTMQIADAKLFMYGPSVYAMPHCFGIQPFGKRRVFVLQAASAEERLNWLQALGQAALAWEPVLKGIQPTPRSLPLIFDVGSLTEVNKLAVQEYSDSDSEKEDEESDLSIDSENSDDDDSHSRVTLAGALGTLGLADEVVNVEQPPTWEFAGAADSAAPCGGFLLKLGHNNNKWKRRYFELDEWTLNYYTHSDKKELLGTIHMVGVVTEHCAAHKEQWCMSLTETVCNQRKYMVIANSEEDMHRWLAALVPRHRFVNRPMPLQISLKEHRHIAMTLSPDMAALQAVSTSKEDMEEHEKKRHGMTANNISNKAKSKMVVKSTVSKEKRRFVLDGFDLDLTYVTDRLIAMGFPSTGTEAVYRNSMEETRRMLDTRHAGHHRVYNLCSERTYPHDSFQGKVVWFPFDDHNPPCFADMNYFCKDVADFLSQHPQNVAAVHCKAGKGRTGMMITVLLIYCGEWETADEALRYYAFARTTNQEGVTIPSQRRWVQYYEKYMKLSANGLSLPKAERMVLKKIAFSAAAPSWNYFTVSSHGFSVDSRDFKKQWTKDKGKQGVTVTVGEPCSFCTDVEFVFYKEKVMKQPKRAFAFWLHTQFIENYTVTLEKSEIDKVSKSKKCDNFTVTVTFQSAADQNIKNHPPFLDL